VSFSKWARRLESFPSRRLRQITEFHIMAITSSAGFDVAALRTRVLETYDRVARDPTAEFHFHRGTRYAVR
jgi:hypothetical protein